MRRGGLSYRVRGPAARKRAIWINVPFGAVSFTETANTQQLLVPEDWESQYAGNGNEVATLRAIVGEIIVMQTTVGTAGGNAFWGMYIADKDATVLPSFSVAGMADVDWLRTGVRGTSATVTASVLQASNQFTVPIAVKAKRRLKSRDAIYICAQYGTDAAAPAGVLSGLLRFLVARG